MDQGHHRLPCCAPCGAGLWGGGDPAFFSEAFFLLELSCLCSPARSDTWPGQSWGRGGERQQMGPDGLARRALPVGSGWECQGRLCGATRPGSRLCAAVLLSDDRAVDLLPAPRARHEPGSAQLTSSRPVPGGGLHSRQHSSSGCKGRWEMAQG